MWIYVSIPLLVCLNTVISRDIGKSLSMKTSPYITNSLVNLGKMDISFHFNAHPEDLLSRSKQRSHGSSSFFSPKLEPVIEEPCPCSSLTYLKDSSQNHPTDLLNRILSGNDLFSSKEPSSSPLCCDSHEHVQEDILFEFGPKQSQMIIKPQPSSFNSFSLLPFLLENYKQRPTLPTVSANPKAVEIFFFPKKRGILPMDYEKPTANKNKEDKVNIKIVGDREIRNDFKAMKFVPPLPSSVKKDLALQEKNKSATKNVEEVPKTVTDRHLNTVV
ncbi:uncharacterized protein LOC123872041 [Maniola jurtina]|uniref:uncharacterized protein LOC123872041 n=1 Tax=Maniola jurtina TaxID=191418 RepID=UPI001E68B480|nr:uncharacterized protein LOC123872041 [Maniola jurtina]XP_045772126.1 uncharacterized protein LOC123872041 [Maniola jurtina]XP_045772127.1 uncharacterized protein LOC123872041 [Maniola jurtina]XP_045772129.1 uncharacterized protein LOC123872041 [Maniola jurtina]XP_045772130.1 uncharacterized protein LOC123872041 [Maniola jurtina]